MEFGPSKSIVVSAGNRINIGEVKRLYARKLNPSRLMFERYAYNYRYPRISFNDQLDLFYEKCGANNDCRECIGFFHTKLTLREEQEKFCEKYISTEENRLSKLKRKWNSDKIHVKPAQKDKFMKDSKRKYDERQKNIIRKYILKKIKQNEIDERQKIYTQIPEYLEFELFYGYRHTIEFDDSRREWRMYELWKLENLRYWSEEERLWPSSSTYEDRLLEKNIISDITVQIENSKISTDL